MNLVFVRAQILLLVALLCPHILTIVANPLSKPYIPFRTNPFDSEGPQQHHHELVWNDSTSLLIHSTVQFYNPEAAKLQCPFQFSLGVSSSSGGSTSSMSGGGSNEGGGADPIVSAAAKAFGIIQPPVIYPIHPSQGPGRQVLYTTQYEHLDLLSPITVSRTTGSASAAVGGGSGSGGKGGMKDDSVLKEGLAELPDFPLLFESSSFLTSPIIHDVNGDGIPDAILTDYDGGIYIIGLYAKPGTKRFFHRGQAPRMFLRRNWVEERLKEASPKSSAQDEESTTTRNDTQPQYHDVETPRDPYHSYFEYSYTDGNKPKEDVLQGVTANLLGQDTSDLKALMERRGRLVKHEKKVEQQQPEQHEPAPDHTDQHHRRLQSAESPHADKEDHPAVTETSGVQESGSEANHRSVTEHEQKNAAKQADVPKEDGAAGAQQHNAEGAGKQEPKVTNEAPKEPEKGQSHESTKDEVKAEPPKEAPNAQAEPGDASKIDTGRDVREQVPEGKAPKDAAPVDAHKQNPQDEGGLKQAAPAEADKPGSDQHQVPRTESQQHVQKVETPKIIEKSSETQRDALGVDPKSPSQHTDAQSKLNQDEQKVGATTDQHQSEGEVPKNVQADAVRDGPPTDAKVDDKEWDQIRGGEDGRDIMDDAFAGQPSPRKSKDLGDDYRRYPKDDEVRAYGGYDDYYGDRVNHVRERESYYDDKHYIRLPPHILANPVISEIPKLYDSNNGMEEILVVPVSYYMDEDEYDGLFSYKRFEPTDHGDETEVRRGMYVASAVMVYTLGESPRWGRQEHLDLSTDFTAPENATLMQGFPLLEDKTKMGAFALSSPTVADIDGDGNLEILIGTSMGMVYAHDARHLYNKDGWPVQMQRPVETRILVEDVRGDTNLEIFVADVGGNVVCLDHKANKLWHRNLPKSLGIDGTRVTSISPMTLGDVNGDGNIDVVLAFGVKDAGTSDETVYVYALTASTGADIPNFPMAFKLKKGHELEQIDNVPCKKIPQPLLVDLHGDQRHLKAYLNRNGTTWTQLSRASPAAYIHGGKASGLHIIAPLGTTLFIIEAGSGCTHSVEIGDQIEAMVQADDVHGTNSLDLVIATTSGNIITLESASPFHPLNTWSNGEARGSKNSFAHGYSASQGIFVHEESRQFRDIFGIYVPITFQIFDNRPGIKDEPAKRLYQVEVRDGTSSQRPILRKNYNATGVYTERVYIPYGPGFYTLSVVLKTSHGLMYEDSFHLGYNVHYMDGFGVLLWVPLVAAAICIVICGRKKGNWDDDEFGVAERSGLGILGRSTLPTSS